MEQDQQLLNDYHRWSDRYPYLQLVGEENGVYLWGYWCGGILFIMEETYDAAS